MLFFGPGSHIGQHVAFCVTLGWLLSLSCCFDDLDSLRRAGQVFWRMSLNLASLRVFSCLHYGSEDLLERILQRLRSFASHHIRGTWCDVTLLGMITLTNWFRWSLPDFSTVALLSPLYSLLWNQSWSQVHTQGGGGGAKCLPLDLDGSWYLHI